jgi:hypothetical protein
MSDVEQGTLAHALDGPPRRMALAPPAQRGVEGASIMAKTMVKATKLYDKHGRHLATQIDRDTMRDERTGQLHRLGQRRTSQTPRPRTMSREEAGRLIVEALNKDVPAPPTLAQIVEQRKKLGLL